nr:Chain P, NC/p1 substrate peptide [Human immunodeficiency virus 1]
QVNFLGK